MKKNAFTSTIFYLWTLVVFVLLVAPASLFSSGQKPLIPFLHTDKIIHFVMFGFFAFFLYFYLLQKGFEQGRKLILVCLLSAAAYGLAGEVLQLLTASLLGRSFSWWDFVADTLGAIVATFVAHSLCKKCKT